MRIWLLIALALSLGGCKTLNAAYCDGTVNVPTNAGTAVYVSQNDRPHGEAVAVNNRYRKANCK